MSSADDGKSCAEDITENSSAANIKLIAVDIFKILQWIWKDWRYRCEMRGGDKVQR